MKLVHTIVAAGMAAGLIMASGGTVAAQDTSLSPSVLTADARMSVAQVRADVALAKEAFERVHPGYTRYATKAEMDAGWQAIIDRAEAQGGMTLPEFYLASELALVTIRCDHTKAELPKSLRDVREGQPVYLPMRWVLIEGRGIVETPGAGTGLKFGDEILSIDGRPLADVIAGVEPYVPVDGYTEWARAGGIAQSLEFMGGAVDHFGALLRDVPEVAALEVQGMDGETRKLEIPRVDFAAWSAMGDASGANFKDALTLKRIGNDAAYLSVETFVNYRNPVEPSSVYDPVFEAIEAEGRRTLILDLRSNGGGSTDASFGLLSNLVTEAFTPRKALIASTLDLDGIRPHLQTWDRRALNPDPMGFNETEDGRYSLKSFVAEELNPLQPADFAFGGRLIVLTSNGNSSGSTNIITALTEIGRATTVGEKTGGSKEGPTAGLQFTLTLPHSGVRMRLPFFHVKNNVKSFERGLGITPDIAAPMTVEAYRAGRDPALEAAMELVEAETEGAPAKAVAEIGGNAPTASAADFAALAGEGWSGTLDYLNYGSEDRSTIPVRMVVDTPKKRSMAYGLIYPGEEDANSRDRIRFARNGRRIDGMAITGRSVKADGTLVLVTQGEGSDNNQPADIRLTFEIAPSRFVIRKDVRFAGGEFFNRNQYRLTR